MPIYEYECMSCGSVTEEWQKISDPPLQTCPHCSGKVKKLMSMNTFHLKGSGWYVTDYSKKDQGGAAVAPKVPEKKETGTKETTSTPAKTSSSTATE